MAGLEMDATCITYEAVSLEQDVFPKTKEPVWILGKQYITDRGKGNFIRQNEILKRRRCQNNFSEHSGALQQ